MQTVAFPVPSPELAGGRRAFASERNGENARSTGCSGGTNRGSGAVRTYRSKVAVKDNRLKCIGLHCRVLPDLGKDSLVAYLKQALQRGDADRRVLSPDSEIWERLQGIGFGLKRGKRQADEVFRRDQVGCVR